jgi:hypothetical protein
MCKALGLILSTKKKKKKKKLSRVVNPPVKEETSKMLDLVEKRI